MRNYTTQMDAARKGILTPEIETVAKKEHMPVEKLMQLVAEGKVAICANKKHTCLDPRSRHANTSAASFPISCFAVISDRSVYKVEVFSL